jgi:hypothetical protein
MKYLFATLVIVLFSSIGFGQAKDTVTLRTKIEEFQSRTSTLIGKETIEIVRTKAIKVEVMKVKILSSGESYSGVIIEWSAIPFGGESSSGRSYLDVDELVDLENSIAVMLEVISKPIPANDTELSFETKAGLQVTVFKYNNNWKISLDHRYRYRAFQTISTDDLTKLKFGLSAAKAKL